MRSERQQILERAIQKAIDGGWLGIPSGYVGEERWYYPDGDDLLKWSWTDYRSVYSDGAYDDYEEIHINAIIFNHDFAKALWGEDKDAVKASNHHSVATLRFHPWQRHLMGMVIADDPIKYLGENI